MFAVPGWDISAKSLVREQPEAKPRKNSADPSQSKKRKRTQLESEKSTKVEGGELEKLWDQHFGSNGKQGGHEGGKSKKHGTTTEVDPARSKSNGALNQHANAGERQSTVPEQKTNTDNDGDEKLSRKQKKLKNTHKRVQADSLDALDGPVGATSLDETTQQQDSSKGHGRNEANELPPQSQKQVRRHGKNVGLAALASTSEPQTDQGRDSHTSIAPAATTQQGRKHGKPSPAPPTALTPLQSKMALKLTSARFRHLNQQLYTTPSSTSLTLFQTTPSLFSEYHSGFTNSTLSWPTNPVSLFITSILTQPALLPRRKTGSCTIADLGCGDAPLARALLGDRSSSSAKETTPTTNHAKKLSLQIHSYDLHAANKHVTVSDIAHLPLRDGEADIAIFCLSLMGTNWLDFVEECWRILRGDGKGEVWVAEVKSRFGRVSLRNRPKGTAVENSVGKKRKLPQQQQQKQKRKGHGDQDEEDALDDELFVEDSKMQQDGEGVDATDISAFVQVFQRRGFKLKEDSVDKSNKMFVSMVFYKTGVPTAGKHKGLKWNGKEYQKQHEGKMKFTSDDDAGDVDPKEEAKVLKPCVYKTR